LGYVLIGWSNKNEEWDLGGFFKKSIKGLQPLGVGQAKIDDDGEEFVRPGVAGVVPEPLYAFRTRSDPLGAKPVAVIAAQRGLNGARAQRVVLNQEYRSSHM
jgi:hypothetical protein